MESRFISVVKISVVVQLSSKKEKYTSNSNKTLVCESEENQASHAPGEGSSSRSP